MVQSPVDVTLLGRPVKKEVMQIFWGSKTERSVISKEVIYEKKRKGHGERANY